MNTYKKKIVSLLLVTIMGVALLTTGCDDKKENISQEDNKQQVDDNKQQEVLKPFVLKTAFEKIKAKDLANVNYTLTELKFFGTVGPGLGIDFYLYSNGDVYAEFKDSKLPANITLDDIKTYTFGEENTYEYHTRKAYKMNLSNVLSIKTVITGNSGWKTAIFLKSDGTISVLNATGLNTIGSMVLVDNYMDLKNIISLYETTYGAYAIDVDGNIYLVWFDEKLVQ